MYHQGANTISLSQQAYTTIKHKIVSLELAPGTVIDEAGLRAELALGRTPIREALQRLALDKLVIIVPRRGTFVTEIALSDLQRLFEARIVLESLAARLAAQRGSREHWQHMAEALNQLPESVEDHDAWIAIDKLCHEIMYEAADNKFLEDTLVTLYALSLRLWYYALSQISDMRRAVLEHLSILGAMRAGDADTAALLMEHHIQTFQEEIQAEMLGPSSSNGERHPSTKPD